MGALSRCMKVEIKSMKMNSSEAMREERKKRQKRNFSFAFHLSFLNMQLCFKRSSKEEKTYDTTLCSNRTDCNGCREKHDQKQCSSTLYIEQARARRSGHETRARLLSLARHHPVPSPIPPYQSSKNVSGERFVNS